MLFIVIGSAVLVAWRRSRSRQVQPEAVYSGVARLRRPARASGRGRRRRSTSTRARSRRCCRTCGRTCRSWRTPRSRWHTAAPICRRPAGGPPRGAAAAPRPGCCGSCSGNGDADVAPSEVDHGIDLTGRPAPGHPAYDRRLCGATNPVHPLGQRCLAAPTVGNQVGAGCAAIGVQKGRRHSSLDRCCALPARPQPARIA